jgi:trehalose 6-phosphate phosphatase
LRDKLQLFQSFRVRYCMTVFPHFPLISPTAPPIVLPRNLLDIAPTPDSVAVARDLPEVLCRLRATCGDALAVVTVDQLLGDSPHAVAGEHGGAVQHAPGAPVERVALPPPPPEWLAEAAAVAQAHPGILLEHKQRGFVLHYRAVPELGDLLRKALEQLMAPDAHRFLLQAAHMAWQVKPRGADKGTVIAQLMRRAPFAGRVPIFIGDDVSDEDRMRVARATGGAGLRVPDLFGDAVGAHAWLAAAAAAPPRREAA